MKGIVANSFQTLTTNHEAINTLTHNGDIPGLLSLTMTEDPENPVGGFSHGIFQVDKYLHVPDAALYWVGGKIKATLDSIMTKVKTAESNLAKNVDNIKNLTSKGDISALYNLKFDAADTPLSGIMGAIFTTSKILHYPATLLHWGGNKIAEGFNSIKSAISSDRSAHETALADLGNLADQGDISAIWNKNVVFSPLDPLSSFWSTSLTITKLFYTVTSMFTALGKAIKNKLIDVGESIWSWLKKPFVEDGESTESTGGPVESAYGGLEREGVGGPSEGGNPLNKPYKVTSYYGKRTAPHSGFHKGIDLVPNDGSGKAEVGSRFSGKVTKVVRNVADTDHAYKGKSGWYYPGSHAAGNYVQIDTDSGYRIKNMHLKQGSIPSGIKEGAKVTPGTKLGTMGTTGWSTGPHLHYQIEKGFKGDHINPLPNVKSGGTLSSFTTLGTVGNTSDTNPSSNNSNYTSSLNDSPETSSGSGVLAQIIDKIKEIGNNFLSALTGGLLGNTSTSSTDSSTDSTDTSNITTSASTTSTTTTVDASGVKDGDAASLWQYFINKDYTEFAIAGILGCWTKESNNTAKLIEGDYVGSLKKLITGNYDRIQNDRNWLDTYAQEMFNMYARSNVGINRSAYKGPDGHYYPGIGYGQWTGPRGKALLDFAKSQGTPWYSPSTQLAYFEKEINGNYSKTKQKIMSAKSPEDAAELFCRGFEGYTQASGIKARKKAARSLYDKYHGKYKKKTSEIGPKVPNGSLVDILKGANAGGDDSEFTSYGFENMSAAERVNVAKDPGSDSSPFEYSDLRSYLNGTTYEGVGGDNISNAPASSNISSNSKYVAANKTKQQSRSATRARNASNINNRSYTDFGAKQSQNITYDEYNNVTGATGSTDLSNVISMMAQIIDELSRIGQNTGLSNNLLGAINEKDFVDQGVRDSLNALGNVRRKSYTKGRTTSSTARSVASVARP